MALNESISSFISQGFEELTTAQISFGLKLMVLFGAIFLFNTLARTGGSLINLALYVIVLIKWIIFKIMRKDI